MKFLWDCVRGDFAFAVGTDLPFSHTNDLEARPIGFLDIENPAQQDVWKRAINAVFGKTRNSERLDIESAFGFQRREC